MKKSLAGALIFGAALSTAANALDLTPHETIGGAEGPPVKRYFIEDAGKNLSFKIDNKMTVSGASASLAFGFMDVPSASMKLVPSPVRTLFPFDDKGLEAYRVSARGFIPPDASNIELEEEKPNPIAINGWTSYQFAFTYSLFGLSYHRTVTFVNLRENEQVVLDVNSVATEYAKVYARGYRVLNSITDVPIKTSGPT